MPKGGLHSLPLLAAPSADFYLKLTYNDLVCFNERERLFKLGLSNDMQESGYVQCTEMRKFWKSAEEYDNKIKKHIIVTNCGSH